MLQNGVTVAQLRWYHEFCETAARLPPGTSDEDVVLAMGVERSARMLLEDFKVRLIVC